VRGRSHDAGRDVGREAALVLARHGVRASIRRAGVARRGASWESS